jgi:hypothetical protein
MKIKLQWNDNAEEQKPETEQIYPLKRQRRKYNGYKTHTKNSSLPQLHLVEHKGPQLHQNS